MYSCPTDDIHSVYIDNELPMAYVKDYEAHLETCPECKAKYERLKKIHTAMQEDSKNLSFDAESMDKSFERLQTKMKYSKNTGKSSEFQHQFKMPDWKSISRIAVAAAAAVVIVSVPVKFSNAKKNSPAQIASITPVTRPQINDFASKKSNVVVNGNLRNEMTHTVSTSNIRSAAFSDMDVFRPAFDENQNISIKISIPGITGNDQEQFMEIKLPVNTITGQLSESR